MRAILDVVQGETGEDSTKEFGRRRGYQPEAMTTKMQGPRQGRRPRARRKLSLRKSNQIEAEWRHQHILHGTGEEG